MYGPGLPVLGTFNLPRTTASGGIPFFQLIPPFGGDGESVQSWSVAGIGGKKDRGQGRPHVTKVIYSTGGTAHLLTILRPLNFTIVKTAVAPNGTSIVLADDPGVYSTNFRYPIVGGKPAQAADNPISAGDYIAYQMADGTWQASLVTAGSYTGLTVAAIPNNGVGINAGALFYFFGGITDVEPLTGQTQPQTQIASSQTRDASWADPHYGIVSALHDGDPMIFFSNNASAQGYLEALQGFYSNR